MGYASRGGSTLTLTLTLTLTHSNPSPNQASEVYAFGIVAWEVLTAKVPWEGYSLAKLTKAIIKEERPPLPPQGDFQLVKSCWAQEPQPQP